MGLELGKGRVTGSVSRVYVSSDSIGPAQPETLGGRQCHYARILKTSTSKAEEMVSKGRRRSRRTRERNLTLKPIQTTFPFRIATASSAPRLSQPRGAAAFHCKGSKCTRLRDDFINRQLSPPVTELEASHL